MFNTYDHIGVIKFSKDSRKDSRKLYVCLEMPDKSTTPIELIELALVSYHATYCKINTDKYSVATLYVETKEIIDSFIEYLSNNTKRVRWEEDFEYKDMINLNDEIFRISISRNTKNHYKTELTTSIENYEELCQCIFCLLGYVYDSLNNKDQLVLSLSIKDLFSRYISQSKRNFYYPASDYTFKLSQKAMDIGFKEIHDIVSKLS